MGWLQQEVMEEVKAKKKPVIINKILWSLAKKHKAICPTSEKIHNIDLELHVIDLKFSNSFNRAVNRLVEGGYLLKEKKKIIDIQDLFESYSFRTSRLEVKEARLIILPEVRKYILKTSRDMGKFTYSQTETHYIENLKKEQPDKFKEVVEKWKVIQDEILGVYCRCRIDSLLNFVMKGRSLYLDRRLSHKDSLFYLLGKLKNDLCNFDDGAVCNVEIFYEESFPEKSISYDYLKSQIYLVVNFGIHQRPVMKKDFKEYLRKNIKDVIIKMPGHCEPESLKQHIGFLYNETVFSPLLDIILDRHILSDFIFLS